MLCGAPGCDGNLPFATEPTPGTGRTPCIEPQRDAHRAAINLWPGEWFME